jgi:acetylornithine/succinyldiaminopimelate/putrescine aminotransferase
MKLAKRITRRSNMIAFKDSYHGSTQGALSIIGDEYWRNAFRPLLPGILHLPYNTFGSLEEINENTACVIAESVQAESGIITPSTEWMQALRKKCTDTGTLLVLDEIQAGFGRTGKLWAFEHFGIVPDVLLLGKALGGGMPLGAFIAGKSLMDAFTENPVLGHITTFGGHPVSCTAGMAAMKVLLEEVPYNIDSKDNSQFPYWRSINLNNFEKNKSVIDHCLRKGVLTDWFLFAPHCLRISPALYIPSGLYEKALAIIEEGISNNV